MNIKITYNWLLEYLDTDAAPAEIQKYLSLCGPTVDSVERNGDDYILSIEVTSNRVDAASVFGIAQEALAILPQFGKKAVLKKNPIQTLKNEFEFTGSSRLNLKVDSHLCPRFACVIFKGVEIKPSPPGIQKRLQSVGIRPINNVVDISNYLMVEFGQPSHIFDFDNIDAATMILRKSKKGEKITTLDGKTYSLPGGDIVIVDGSGRLIDLCGIMGGENTHVTEKTKNILVFMQVYDGMKIRKTSMILGARSQASGLFEKDLDPEKVLPAIFLAVELLKKNAGGAVDSPMYDIYPKPFTGKSIIVEKARIDNFLGIKLPEKKIIQILSSLGFYAGHRNGKLNISIPSFRAADILIPEDIIEEVARIYGLHNLPAKLPKSRPTSPTADIDKLFKLELRLKYLLKHSGFNEVYNYSMISKDQIEKLDLDPKKHLGLISSISKELEYLRRSLLPSLLKNIKDNQGGQGQLYLFEMGKVYEPKAAQLPLERRILGVICNTDFFDLKGIIQLIFKELNISKFIFEKRKEHDFFAKKEQASIFIEEKEVGKVGKVSDKLLFKNEISTNVFYAELDVEKIIKLAQTHQTYKEPVPYAVIKQDLTIKKKSDYQEIVKKIFENSKYVLNVEYLGLYNEKLNIRIYFGSPNANLTEAIVGKEMARIKNALEV